MTGRPPRPTADLGRRIREARLARGWPQWELARRVGVTAGTISAIECGRRDGTRRTRRRLVAILGLGDPPAAETAREE